MATISRTITLKHRANLGEEPEDVAFQEGDEVTILAEWETHYLLKSSDGRLFNVQRDVVNAG